jgi:alpha-methylacyl-CoA racemase
MTGWGQDGPLAQAAGHDLNYIALAGALDLIGRQGQPPTPPVNLVGDYAGGGMVLAFGMVCALLECQRSGRGQVIDASIVDGAALLTAVFHGIRHAGFLREERGTNIIDSGSHFYDAYETADGKYISIASFEPHFYAELLRRLGLEGEDLPQMDPSRWPEFKARFARLFQSKTRQQWCELLEGTDACFAPVLSIAEAPRHPHHQARGTFVEVAGVIQPRPAPRFSRTPAEIQGPPARPGEHTVEALRDWGVSSDSIATLKNAGAIV